MRARFFEVKKSPHFEIAVKSPRLCEVRDDDGRCCEFQSLKGALDFVGMAEDARVTIAEEHCELERRVVANHSVGRWSE